jgi:hypothetical protein
MRFIATFHRCSKNPISIYRYIAITATERLASTTEKLAHCEKQLEQYRKR